MNRIPLPTPEEVSAIAAELLVVPVVAQLTRGLRFAAELAPPNPDFDGPSDPFLARQILRAIRRPQALTCPLPSGSGGSVIPFVPLVSEDRRAVTWTLQLQDASGAFDHELRFVRGPQGWQVVS